MGRAIVTLLSLGMIYVALFGDPNKKQAEVETAEPAAVEQVEMVSKLKTPTQLAVSVMYIINEQVLDDKHEFFSMGEASCTDAYAAGVAHANKTYAADFVLGREQGNQKFYVDLRERAFKMVIKCTPAKYEMVPAK